MSLSRDEREMLEARYALWGVDRVREDLERPDRELFCSPEVTEFARAWIARQETALRSRTLLKVALALAGLVLAVLVVAPMLG